MTYRVRPAKFAHGLYDGYWVTIYLLFDGERTYTFFSESDWLDNYQMMIEAGFCPHHFYHDVLCTPTQCIELYNKVKEYVSSSNSH